MTAPLSALLAVVATLSAALLVPVQAQTQVSTQISTPPAAQRVAADSIVAVVGTEVITRRELSQRVRNAELQLQQQGTALPARDLLERQVLERAITDRSIVQWARENGIRVDDGTVDTAFANIARQNGLSVEGFRQRLEREGMDVPRFRRDLREEITIFRAREREVDSKINVSEAEVDAFLAQESGAAAGETELNLAQILIRPKSEAAADIAAARERAQALFEQARGGADFAQLARANSAGAEADKGGEMGWRTTDRIPELFTKTVAGLRAGELSAPVQSGAGFHVLKLLGRRAAGSAGSANAEAVQTKVRHILLRVTPEVNETEAQRRLSAIRDRIVNKQATFEELAKTFSADGSAAQGGDLGWAMSGDMVPEFESVMNQSRPGEVSQPFRSQFGWHILEVTDRAKRAIPVEKQRQLARNLLRDRKVEEQYVDWARLVRDRTYVENRLEAAAATAAAPAPAAR